MAASVQKDKTPASTGSSSTFDLKKVLILLAAVAVYLIISNLPRPEGLSHEALKSIAFIISAVILWVTEVIPSAVVTCAAIMLMGLLKIVPTKEALSNFMIATVVFVFAAFILATGFVQTGLGRRVALRVSGMFGTRADRVLLSYMLPTSIISAVLADIPTAIIFAGIAHPILQQNHCEPGKSNFGRAVMMGIPIAAAIGGFATPAGSGLNVLTISLLKSTANVDINFLQWTAIGFPVALILTFIAWWIVLKFCPPEIDTVKGLEDVAKQRDELGPMTVREKKFLAVFACALVLWFTQPWNKIDTAVVAILAAMALFLPGIDLLTWDDVKGRIGWDVLFLIGGANAVGMALSSTGAASWIASSLLGGLATAGVFVTLLVVTAWGIFSHYVIPVANATIAVSIPVLAALAVEMGINPALLAIPIGFTASCVFVLPLDPIPLVTYNYKYWTFGQMMKPGLVISLVWLVIMACAMYLAQMIGII